MEPPSRLEFSNSSGGWLDCSGNKIVWVLETGDFKFRLIQRREVPSRRQTGCRLMEPRSGTLAAFVGCSGTERWCCCRFQPPPTVKTSTARSIGAWPRIASVGLFHETFKCELVSSNFFQIYRGKSSRARIICIQGFLPRTQLLSGLYVLQASVPACSHSSQFVQVFLPPFRFLFFLKSALTLK